MFGDVIVPLDGSELAAHALEVGAAIAQANDADLRVLAYTRSSDKPPLFLPVSDQVNELARRLQIEPILTIEPLERFVANQILAEVAARPGSLICMASHGRGRMAAYFGSVASEVLTTSPGPVVICGPNYVPGRFQLEQKGPIIVALDGSQGSEAILAVAEAWSVVFDLPLEVVTVLPPETPSALAAAVSSGDVLESGYVGAVASGAGKVTARLADFEVLHDNHPARAIIDEAKTRNATLVAMATHAPTGLERLRKGSVTAEVIRHSTAPVLAIQTSS